MNRDEFMENAPASWDAVWRDEAAAKASQHAAEQQQEAAAIRAGVCAHCRGTGTVPNWTDGSRKACFACNGTGGPRTSKMAYNRHQG